MSYDDNDSGGRGGFGGRGGGGGYGAPRDMTDAVCSDCGQACQVPFKPTEGRPVYCRNCFPKHKKF